ncbi:hypothetical protein [Coleofasciculus sp. H7-2]|uniref:hypothetical protein n=1 Tax=Coleofasciculus sp. H7-2 TaxID=3351545 RepID=UPI003672631E
MEEVTTAGFPTETIAQKTSQLNLIVQALVLTGILSLTATLTLPNPKVTISKSPLSEVSLLKSVQNAVFQDVSQHSGLPKSALRIVQTQPQTWSDDCLDINNLEVLCTEMQVPGWQVTVANGQRRWIYRTNASGSMVKLAQGVTSPNQNGK